MTKTFRIYLLFFILSMHSIAWAGPYTADRIRACPEKWENLKDTIYVNLSTNPWGANGTTAIDSALDRAQVHAYMATANPHNTLTRDDVDALALLKDDPLTIASDCAFYKGLDGDTPDLVPPSTLTLNRQTGWIPAALF